MATAMVASRPRALCSTGAATISTANMPRTRVLPLRCAAAVGSGALQAPAPPLPPVVNWHLEARCNYGCTFCEQALLRNDTRNVIALLHGCFLCARCTAAAWPRCRQCACLRVHSLPCPATPCTPPQASPPLKT
jgi:hypothetical protein